MLVWVLGDKSYVLLLLDVYTVVIKKAVVSTSTLYGEINKLVSFPHVSFCIIKIIVEGKPTAQGITGSLVYCCFMQIY